MTITQLKSRIKQLEAENKSLRKKLDHAEVIAGIKEGLEQANRGLGRPFRQVAEELRRKYKISASKRHKSER